MFKLLKKTNNFRLWNRINQYFLSSRKLMSASKIKVEVMPNGLKVATNEFNSPLICTSIFIQCGSRYENICNNGVSSFIERMVISNKDFQETVYNSCIKIRSTTTREYQMFSAVSPIENTSRNVEILFKMISDLDFDDTELQLQKKFFCLEAVDYDNNPKEVVFDYLHQTAFQGTPLAQTVMGPTKNILEFDKNKISNFKSENYQPHRLFLAVSGGVSHATMIDEVRRNLHCLRHTECKECNIGAQRFTGSQIISRDDSMPYAHVAIAIEAPGYNSPEYLTLLVASSLTDSWDRTQGGTICNGSPLARATSTSLLCEKFESFYIAYQDVGLWGIYFVGDRLCLDDMVLNIQDQWMQMCTTIVQTDAQRAVNLAKLKLAKQVNGVANSCRDIGLQLLYKSEHKTLSELYCELSNVTDKMIKDVAFNYIYNKCPVVAAIGPTEVLPDYNRIRSGMYWLRL